MPDKDSLPGSSKRAVAKVQHCNRYAIDIGDKLVHVIKINKAGIIVKAASAEAPTLPEKLDNDYITQLTAAIKKAARAAKLPRGLGIPCVVVTGGSHVIIRRFTWPEMPLTAIRANALTELAHYLPEDIAQYTVGQCVLKHSIKTESTHAKIEVLAAAIPTDLSAAYNSAVRDAGFAPSRLDIRENARGKLTAAVRVKPELDANRINPASFAVLDINSQQVNLSIYLEGMFYSNRYFASFALEEEASEDSDLLDAIVIDEDTGRVTIPAPVAAFDTDALANEVSSIIDYILYRERDSSVECILLFGDENKMPNIFQSLADNLDIPVYRRVEWLKPLLLHSKLTHLDITHYLDAYGASLAPPHHLANKLGADLDVRPLKKSSPAKQLLIPMTVTASILTLFFLVSILIQSSALSALKGTEKQLDRELAEYTITPADLETLRHEVNGMSALIHEIDSFFRLYPQASPVLGKIFGLESDGHRVLSVSTSSGVTSVAGTTADFNHLADNLEILREDELFEMAHVQMANAHTPTEFDNLTVAQTDFNMTLDLQFGAGVR